MQGHIIPSEKGTKGRRWREREREKEKRWPISPLQLA